jgi:hypothetical protein
MPSPMFPGYYLIFSKIGGQHCIGVNGDKKLCLKAFDKSSNANTWIVNPIPGTIGHFILEHQATGWCARFGAEPIQLFDFAADPDNLEFAMVCDDVDNGYTAINNHDRTRVFDDAGGKPDGMILPWKWNGGDNQRWRFVSTAVLDNPS